MKFTKMHGIGNDYVYVNAFIERVSEPARLARAMSDRFTGVGSDGLILIGPSPAADARMEMYNADGSRGRMCGNGIRCVAKYVVEHGIAAGPELGIDTDAGIRSVSCQLSGGKVESVRVNMGPPLLAPLDIPVTVEGDRVVDRGMNIGGKVYPVTCVSMGNPHAVVFVDDPDAIELPIVGPAFERAPQFPESVNAHFASALSRTHVVARTWERGSGATRACGTGACAIGVAGVLTDRTERCITVSLPGGDLQIEWADDGCVYMTGPAVEVFTGDWTEG